jgi:hypothetical protein
MNQLKYDIHKIGFIGGIVLLVFARGYLPLIGIFSKC